MRILFPVTAAAAFILLIVAAGCTGEKAPSPPGPPERIGTATGTKTAPKIGMKWFSGTIEELDASAGTFTLKGPKGTVEFQAEGRARKELDGMKIGDRVIVKHTGETAHSIVKPGATRKVPAGKEKEVPAKAVDPVHPAGGK